MKVVETPRPGSTLKTIDKALRLLGFFTTETPEFRLSDLARAAGMDKVTTMRVLASLAHQGFVEQHPETKKYRLGTAILRLARIREASSPLISLLQPIVEDLAKTTGETAHSSLISSAGLTTIAFAEPDRATRVWINPTQVLPIHATASGMAYLAYSSPEAIDAMIPELKLQSFTPSTIKSARELRKMLETVRARGCAIANGSFEADTVGIGAPIFDWHGKVVGTVAAACMSSRLDATLQQHVEKEVLRASIAATRALGGRPLPEFVSKV